MSLLDIAVVIPHFQRRPGLLPTALRSVFAQSLAHRICVVICDDSSPSPAEGEVRPLTDLPQDRIHIHKRPNGGAGAARNTALSNVPSGVRYVAFLDSDDSWRPHHLESAISALERGYDAYFADFVAVGYPGIGNMARIGTLRAEEHQLLDAGKRLHVLGVSPIEHQVSDGGGLIQTSTVVYRYEKYAQLRFREEFFNGQDFFFWMDLGEAGASFVFSFDIECDNGEGINIFQASGWGSEKSLQRLRNELFVWTSVERFYKLEPKLLAANRRTIRHLQDSVGRDLIHRLRHRKPISGRLLWEIIKMLPSSVFFVALAPIRIVWGRLSYPHW